MRARFDKLFAKASGQSAKKIARDTQRDFWLTTQAALGYGLVNRVITTVDELG